MLLLFRLRRNNPCCCLVRIALFVKLMSPSHVRSSDQSPPPERELGVNLRGKQCSDTGTYLDRPGRALHTKDLSTRLSRGKIVF